MKKYKVDVSIIMPAFNEEENIEETVRKCFSALREMGLNGEVVVTDDGSLDDTIRILESLSVEFVKLKIVVHSQNEGYGSALRDAAAVAQGEYIATIDSDGQFDVFELPLLIEEHRKGYDLITGYRKKKKDSLFRVIADRGLNMIVKVLFGVRYRDTNCAFKLYGPGVLDKIEMEARSYQAPTEIVLKLHALGYKIGQVGISHYSREKGMSALNPFITVYKMLAFLIYLKLKVYLYRRKIISHL